MVFDVKRFALHDGPGIRTTVFLKGCQMTCWWCHNPESRTMDKELFFYRSRCRHCGRCVDLCPAGVHTIVEENGRPVHRIDRDKCSQCGRCVEVCLYDALKIVGEETTAAQVIHEIVKDMHYYQHSSGGMTLSGGDPLIQPQFAYAILALAKEKNIHTALDTNASNDWNIYEKILPVTDLFLVDLKHTDRDRHREGCGVEFDRVWETLDRLNANGAEIILRCPIIPAFNAEDDRHWWNVAQMARKLGGIKEINYMPYHRLWISKSQALGLDVNHERRDLPEVTAERITDIYNILELSGKPVSRG